MIPYPHDTSDVSPTPEPQPVIAPSAFLDGRRHSPRRRFVLGSCLAALALHAYALSVLPAALEVAWDELAAVQDTDPNLSNDEIGNDPDLPLNYNIDRIEDITIPPPINPNEAPGTIGDPARQLSRRGR